MNTRNSKILFLLFIIHGDAGLLKNFCIFIVTLYFFVFFAVFLSFSPVFFFYAICDHMAVGSSSNDLISA